MGAPTQLDFLTVICLVMIYRLVGGPLGMAIGVGVGIGGRVGIAVLTTNLFMLSKWRNLNFKSIIDIIQ